LFLDFILASKDRGLDLKKEDFSPILLYKRGLLCFQKKSYTKCSFI
jgi:hypothetical protein